jgi:hypothetical protein
LRDYPAAVRQLAEEEKVPLIDLNAMSKTLYEPKSGVLTEGGTTKVLLW